MPHRQRMSFFIISLFGNFYSNVMMINFILLLSPLLAIYKYNLFFVLTNAIRRMLVVVICFRINFDTDFLYFGVGRRCNFD